MTNYKNYQVGDIIAFSHGHSVYEGVIEAIDGDGFSILLTKDFGPWHKNDRFLISFKLYSYEESIIIKSSKIKEETISKIKIPWYKKLFNIY